MTTIILPIPTEPAPLRAPLPIMPRLPPRLLTLPGLAARRVVVTFGSSIGMLRVTVLGDVAVASHTAIAFGARRETIRADMTRLCAWERIELDRLIRWAKEAS
jgi:hypothetical protein